MPLRKWGRREDVPTELQSRYASGGATLGGTTTANIEYQVGPNQGLPNPTYARYATLMVQSGGSITFGREMALGNKKLAAGDAYTFDYVNVARIVVKDDGNASTFTIDCTGP